MTKNQYDQLSQDDQDNIDIIAAMQILSQWHYTTEGDKAERKTGLIRLTLISLGTLAIMMSGLSTFVIIGFLAGALVYLLRSN